MNSDNNDLPPRPFARGLLITTKMFGSSRSSYARLSAQYLENATTVYRARIDYDQSVYYEENHRRAVLALVASWPLGEHLIAARGKDRSDSFYWVLVKA